MDESTVGTDSTTLLGTDETIGDDSTVVEEGFSTQLDQTITDTEEDLIRLDQLCYNIIANNLFDAYRELYAPFRHVSNSTLGLAPTSAGELFWHGPGYVTQYLKMVYNLLCAFIQVAYLHAGIFLVVTGMMANGAHLLSNRLPIRIFVLVAHYTINAWQSVDAYLPRPVVLGYFADLDTFNDGDGNPGAGGDAHGGNGGTSGGSRGVPGGSRRSPGGNGGSPGGNRGAPSGSRGAPGGSRGAPGGSRGTPGGTRGASGGSKGAPTVIEAATLSEAEPTLIMDGQSPGTSSLNAAGPKAKTNPWAEWRSTGFRGSQQSTATHHANAQAAQMIGQNTAQLGAF